MDSYTIYFYNLTISYYQPIAAQPEIIITDITGRVIKIFDFQTLSQGNQTLNCNVTQLKTGVYFIKLKTGNTEVTQKIIKQ